MIRSLYSLSKTKCKEIVINFIKTFIKEKYGKDSTYCILYMKEKDFILLETGKTSGEVHKDFSLNIRTLVMQNLSRTIIPNPKKPSVVCLFIFPSLLKYLSLKEIKLILKDWKGTSCIGEDVVIIYKIGF